MTEKSTVTGMSEGLSPSRLRVAFLFLLAVAISLLFFQVVEHFLLALAMAAVLAGLTHPVYQRFLELFRGHKNIASAAAVLLSLLLVIVPVLLFLGVLVNEAIDVSETAGAWVKQHEQQTDNLQQKLEEVPALRRLLPYQEQILEKAGQITEKAGAFIGQIIVAGAVGTANFFLLLFVMLYAMFYFLIDGQPILEAVLRFTPLSGNDKARLLGTFVSVSRATLKGTLVIGIVQGGLAGLSFAVAGIESAVFWGTVMMVLSIIPGIGTALVWVPAVIFLALSGQTGAAVGVALWCAIVVGTADNVLRPFLVGRDTQMPDLLVLLTTLGGLLLFGAAGIVLGPIVGALFIAAWEIWSAAVDETRQRQTATVEESKPHGK